jgi:hypothetical protein
MVESVWIMTTCLHGYLDVGDELMEGTPTMSWCRGCRRRADAGDAGDELM